MPTYCLSDTLVPPLQEATFGCYWPVDLLHEMGCGVHLASPSQLKLG